MTGFRKHGVEPSVCTQTWNSWRSWLTVDFRRYALYATCVEVEEQTDQRIRDNRKLNLVQMHLT